MASTETEKSAIISELEESLNPSLAALTRLSEDVFALCDDRDGLITKQAYQRLLQCGLEPRYVPEVQWASKRELAIRDLNIMASEELFEEQMASFLQSIPAIDEEEKQISAEEDGELSARDRVLLCTIPTSVFNPLFRHCKSQSAAFYQAVLHHALPSGRAIRKRRRRRTKAKEKADSKSKSEKSREKNERSRKSTIREVNIHMPLPSWEQYSKQVVLAIAKAIADGSTQSLLIATLLLLSVAKEYAQLMGITDAQVLQKFSLPVGHLLGLLIDSIPVPAGATDDAHGNEQEQEQEQEEEQVVLTVNPFRPCFAVGNAETNTRVGDHFVRDTRSSPRSRISDSTATDFATATEEGTNTDDVLSIAGQQSDAGSLIAEMGTETASMENDGEDLNEEDLLAQALALSLGTDASTALAKMIEVETERQSQDSLRHPPAPGKTHSSTDQPTTADVVERFVAPEAPLGAPLSLLQHPCFAQFFEVASAIKKADGSDMYERLTDVSLEMVVCCLILHLSHSAAACEVAQWSMLRRGAHMATPHLPACISPHYLSFMLLEATLSLLTRTFACELGQPGSEAFGAPSKGINPAQDDMEASDVHIDALPLQCQLDRRYMSAWSTINTLRILRVNLLYVVLNNIPVASVGLGTINEDERAQADAEPYVKRLEQTVLDCIGTDVLTELRVLACSDTLQEHYPHEHKPVAALIEGIGCTTHQLVSAVRSGGINAFLTGLTIFKPSALQRLQLLQALLEHIPSTDHQPVEATELATAWERNDTSRLRSLWQRELFSRFCIRMATPDIMKSLTLQPAVMPAAPAAGAAVSTPPSPAADAPLLPPSLHSAGNIRRPQVLEHLRALVGIDSDSDLLTRMYEVVADLRQEAPAQPQTTEPTTAVSVSIEESLECAELTKAMLPKLLARVAVLPKHPVPHLTDAELVSRLDHFGHFLPSCHGEMSLLAQLQQKLAVEYTSGVSNSLLSFNRKKCQDSIEIVDKGHTAVQRGHKTWGTVVAERAMQPNTGVYEWFVRLDKCEKGHVFIGVVTADVGINSYVGGDAHGWGLIGTQALWHDRVKSRNDYGAPFGSGSVMRVCVDTDNHTLSFGTSGGDWGVAFDSLPADRAIYPAVALYQREDRVTLLSMQEVPANGRSESSAVSEIIESQQGFVEYGRLLLSTAENIVVAATGLDDAAARTAATAHPVLCALLPGLAAALVIGSDATQSPGFVTLSLLPQLSILTKRLASLHEMLVGVDSASATAKLGQTLFGSVGGGWIIRSAASEHVPSQEYSLHFEVRDSAEEPADQTVADFRGEDIAGDTQVKVTGTTSSSRIKFLETWAQGSKCLVEGRLSLDGGYFSGKYKEIKSGSTATIEGVRFCNHLDVDACTRALQVTTVLAASCGRLIGHLLTGMDVVLVDEVRPRAGTVESVDESAMEDESKVEREPTETKEAEASAEVPVASEDEVTSNQKHGKRTIESWCSSSFLAGGLPIDATMREKLQRVLEVHLPMQRHEASDVEPLSPSRGSVDSWWFSHCFKELDLQRDGAAVESDLPEPANVLVDIRQGTSTFARLDKYVQDYVGQSFLMKVGGEAAKVARRAVLAALIKHSGCLSAIEQELEKMNANPSNPDVRPQNPLMHIWSATQRVVEHAIRSKADTGLSYAMIAETLTARANFLLRVQPNALCRAIEEQFELDPDFALHTSTSSVDLERLQSHDSGFEDPKDNLDYGSLLAEAVDFLKSGPRDVAALESRMLMTTAKAMFRTAGLNAYLLLVRKADDPMAARGPALPPLTQLCPLTAATEHACRSFIGQASFVSGTFRGGVRVAHYLAGIEGCGERYQGLVRDSFEAVFDHVTQLIQRSTWANYQDGQCVGLITWGIAIRPEDHVFLSRVQIFRVLQTVLDEARAEAELLKAAGESEACAETFKDELLVRAHQRLVQLALRIVHFLAAQVAFSKDKEPSNPAAAIQLTRMPSGPETLSRSLFEMLHAELYTAMRQLVTDIQSTGNPKTAGSGTKLKGQDDTSAMFLNAEQYASRIIRLLHSVVTSSVCQKYVSTPRWLSLLLASVGFGGLGFQRRLIRLLMRLLVEIEPSEFQASSHAFAATGAAMFQDGSIFEEEDTSLGLSAGDLDSAGRHPTDNLLAMLFDAVALSIPSPQGPQEARTSTIATRLLRHDRAAVITIAAESLALLRSLLASERWHDKINEYCALTLVELEQLSGSSVRQVCAILDVYGGRIDVLRVGGFVHLRPSCLVNTADCLAMQIGAAAHTSGLVVGIDSSKRTVETVLLERAYNQSETDEVLHGFSVAGSLPIRPARLSADDVHPTADIIRIGSSITVEIATAIFDLLEGQSIPFMEQLFESTDEDGDAEETKDDRPEDDATEQHDRMLKLHLITSNLRATSAMMKQPVIVDYVAGRRHGLFKMLLKLGSATSSRGNLGVLEAMEQRWAELWHLYARTTLASAERVPASMSAVSLLTGKESLDSDVESRSTPLEARSPLDLREPSSGGSAGGTGLQFSGGLPFGLLSSGVDPSAAVQQMTEMGFPREWCEVALRRCHFNVEMAINFCFEHSDNMNQMIQEDAAMQQAVQSARGAASYRRGIEPPRRNDRAVLARTLLEMGFPSNWCERALQATNNNVDAALTWILTNSDALATEDERGSTTSAQTDGKDEEGTESLLSAFNPLQTVGGAAAVDKALSCTVSSGFPSVGARDFAVREGKWYYEVQLHTGGCMQVGWVDVGFEGNAERGEGVGDCAHSWAYDGWRMYAWHGVFKEWGGKWRAGDVVGCIVDLDDNTMSFTLNGFGEEIGMGIAFRDIVFLGGLYPAASISKNERLQFNFGARPFKFGPPAGYRPFNDHITTVLQEQFDLEGDNDQDLTAAGLRADAIEEQRGLASFVPPRRYFQPDDQPASRRLAQLERSSQQQSTRLEFGALPSDAAGIEAELLDLTSDLTTLYARLAAFRLLIHSPAAFAADVMGPVTTTDGSSAEGSDHEQPAPFSEFLKLLRRCSQPNAKTKVFLSMLALLFPSALSSIPPNLGSKLTAGGGPFLQAMHPAILQMMDQMMEDTSSSDQFTTAVLAEIKSNIDKAVLRGSSEWRQEKGLVPWRADTNLVDDAVGSEEANLIIAVWLTYILISKSQPEPALEVRSAMLPQLLSVWAVGLQSPFVALKLLSARMLSILLQSSPGPIHPSAQQEWNAVTTRLCSAVKFRIWQERASQPVSSEYLQGLCELVVNLGGELVLDGFPNVQIPGVMQTPTFLEQEGNAQAEPVLQHPEELDGLVLTDDGWQTWTGTITQHEIAWDKPAIQPMAGRVLTEKHDAPPALLPGRRVMKRAASRTPRLVRRNSAEQQRNASDTEEAVSSPRLVLSPRSPPAAPVAPMLGTVTEIVDWDGHRFGGRTIEWEDGTTEVINWGVNGSYDVVQVEVDKDGKVKTSYPPPTSREMLLAQRGFGARLTYGVILRLRTRSEVSALCHSDGLEELKSETTESDPQEIDGVLELPDFHAKVYLRGQRWSNGTVTFKETQLLSGMQHTGWLLRHAAHDWQAGTQYEMSPPRSYRESVLGNENVLSGLVTHNVMMNGESVQVMSDIFLQREHLWLFDPNMKAPSITVSRDYKAATADRSERCCVYGNVGFAGGVHYWEIKVEQADNGSLYIGVAEKEYSPGYGRSQRLNRWFGSGFVNYRAAFNATTNEKVYGDHFTAGDTIGVLLDLERGRISFFMDGMKYGEHILADLGCAFDHLRPASPTIRPKVYFPVVGFHKTGDRVTLTPRWLSSTEQTATATLRNVSRATSLLSSWMTAQPTAQGEVDHSSSTKTITAAALPAWLYDEAWLDWRRWSSNQFKTVMTRAQRSIDLEVSISPLACVHACVRLGLSFAMFHGDRFIARKSSGQRLEQREEGVVLGAYDGKLWYRLDVQHSEGGSAEDSALAWCFSQDQIESIELVRGNPVVPPEVRAIRLRKIPAFQGGNLHITYEAGAVLRDGLEIDTSSALDTVPGGTVVLAEERRVNSSNVARHLIEFNGNRGWISERIRGGNEELMVTRVSSASASATNHGSEATQQSAATHDHAETAFEAVQLWKQAARDAGAASKSFLDATSLREGMSHTSFHRCIYTVDGTRSWTTEEDMQLSEWVSICADKAGTEPVNVSCADLVESLKLLPETSALHSIAAEHIVARSALLRVANRYFARALPFMQVQSFHQLWQRDRFGFTNDIDAVSSVLPSQCVHGGTSEAGVRGAKGDDQQDPELREDGAMFEDWEPLNTASRVQRLRRLIFDQTKRAFWHDILQATTTPTPLHQDEYEDPRDVRTIKINRVKAAAPKLVGLSNPNDRLRNSVFGQLHREMRSWPNLAFRRAYVGKGHGGQPRAFKVKFMGEGVNDYGGPYRAVFDQLTDEAQADTLYLGRKAWERSLLPLLIPCPNRVGGVGTNQDKFLFSPSAQSPLTQELMQFFGRLVGTGCRHGLQLALDLPTLVWRPLAGLPVGPAHLDSVDTHAARALAEVEKRGLELERSGSQETPPEWAELTFTTYLSDGTRVSLIPAGEAKQVTANNWRQYVHLAQQARLRESTVMLHAFKTGLSSVAPVELFNLFTARELEALFTGSRNVDVDLLRQCTEYEEVELSDPHIQAFWEVMEEMSAEERTEFLRFVWARSRMPASIQDMPMNFKIQAPQGAAREHPDDYLPHAQTCFFTLSLPAYTSKQILKEKLLYAIKNSPNMDADVRLHSAEGWADV